MTTSACPARQLAGARAREIVAPRSITYLFVGRRVRRQHFLLEAHRSFSAVLVHCSSPWSRALRSSRWSNVRAPRDHRAGSFRSAQLRPRHGRRHRAGVRAPEAARPRGKRAGARRFRTLVHQLSAHPADLGFLEPRVPRRRARAGRQSTPRRVSATTGAWRQSAALHTREGIVFVLLLCQCSCRLQQPRIGSMRSSRFVPRRRRGTSEGADVGWRPW